MNRAAIRECRTGDFGEGRQRTFGLEPEVTLAGVGVRPRRREEAGHDRRSQLRGGRSRARRGALPAQLRDAPASHDAAEPARAGGPDGPAPDPARGGTRRRRPASSPWECEAGGVSQPVRGSRGRSERRSLLASSPCPCLAMLRQHRARFPGVTGEAGAVVLSGSENQIPAAAARLRATESKRTAEKRAAVAADGDGERAV
jgi:hypothetical protein